MSNFKVVKRFIADVTQKAVGQEVLQSLSPGQQIIKVVHDELVALLGGSAEPLRLDGRQPVTVMLAGLQGSGKDHHHSQAGQDARGQGP